MGIPAPLSEREQQILRLMAQGHTQAGAAAVLVLSPHTIHTHMRRILRALDARTSAHAVAIAYEHHWWSDPPAAQERPPEAPSHAGEDNSAHEQPDWQGSSSWSMTREEIMRRWPSCAWSLDQWAGALTDTDLFIRLAEGMRTAAVRRELWRVRGPANRGQDPYRAPRRKGGVEQE